jgi:hypothetical protein
VFTCSEKRKWVRGREFLQGVFAKIGDVWIREKASHELKARAVARWQSSGAVVRGGERLHGAVAFMEGPGHQQRFGEANMRGRERRVFHDGALEVVSRRRDIETLEGIATANEIGQRLCVIGEKRTCRGERRMGRRRWARRDAGRYDLREVERCPEGGLGVGNLGTPLFASVGCVDRREAHRERKLLGFACDRTGQGVRRLMAASHRDDRGVIDRARGKTRAGYGAAKGRCLDREGRERFGEMGGHDFGKSVFNPRPSKVAGQVAKTDGGDAGRGFGRWRGSGSRWQRGGGSGWELDCGFRDDRRGDIRRQRVVNEESRECGDCEQDGEAERCGGTRANK